MRASRTAVLAELAAEQSEVRRLDALIIRLCESRRSKEAIKIATDNISVREKRISELNAMLK